MSLRTLMSLVVVAGEIAGAGPAAWAGSTDRTDAPGGSADAKLAESMQEEVAGGGPFDLLDFLTTNILLPVGGILIAVFAGWVITRSALDDELPGFPAPLYAAWRFLLRFLVPVAVAWVLVENAL